MSRMKNQSGVSTELLKIIMFRVPAKKSKSRLEVGENIILFRIFKLTRLWQQCYRKMLIIILKKTLKTLHKLL